MKKLLILAILPFAPLFAQQPSTNTFIAQATTTALTVQQPAANAKQVQLQIATVYCASASTVTSSWNGTAASATAASIKALPGSLARPVATAWSGSNVGAGTTGPVFQVPAGTERDFSLLDFRIGTGGTTANFTLTTNNSCAISIQWQER